MKLPDLVAKAVISGCNSGRKLSWKIQESENGTLIQLVWKASNSFPGKKSEVRRLEQLACSQPPIHHAEPAEEEFPEEMLGALKPSLSVSRQSRNTGRCLRVGSAKVPTPTMTRQLRQMPQQGQEQYHITSPHILIPPS